MLEIWTLSCSRIQTQRIRCETHCEARGRMLGSCSSAECKPAVTPLTELKSSNLHDDKSNTHSTQRLSVHFLGETRSSVRDKLSVIQTRVANICRFDTRQEYAERLEMNVTHESQPDDPCIQNRRLAHRIEKISRDTLILLELETQRRKHFLYIVL